MSKYEICNEPCKMPNEAMREATVHDILEKTKALTVDIRDSAMFIKESLFGQTVNSNDACGRPVMCARDAMEDIAGELMEIYDILRYVRERL